MTTETKNHLLLELGRGGMGTVFLAVTSRARGFRKFKVIKQLRSELVEEPYVTMFMEEARLAARLNHPNIVQTNEVGFDGKHFFIELEYLEGQTFDALRRRASKADSLPLGLSLHVLIQVLAGLHYAHELQDHAGKSLEIVHRDVSPHNVFVTYEGIVKVLDFGIAKAADSQIETATGMMKGKLTYMAPEQATHSPLDRRADLFPVGVMLWEALTNTRLWAGLSDRDILRELDRGRLPAPRSIAPHLPDGLNDLCVKALAYDPSKRFATAADMQEALEGELTKLGGPFGGKQLAAVLHRLFADRRVAVRKEIEAQIQALDSGIESRGSLEIPVLNEAPGIVQTSTDSTVGERSSGDVLDGTRSAIETSVEAGTRKATRSDAIDQGRTVTAITSESPAAPPARARWRQRRVWALAALALAGGGAFSLRSSLRARTPSPADETDAVAIATVPACVVPSTCAAGSACRATDGACVPLATAACKLLAEPADLRNPKTIWLGAMFAWQSENPTNREDINSLELARRDFAQFAPAFQPGAKGAPRRPIAIVLCDDTKEPEVVARHLVEDVGVPGVIGFYGGGKELMDLVSGIFDQHDVLAVPIMPTPSYRRRSGEGTLLWHVAPPNGEKALTRVVEGVLEPYRRARLPRPRPLRVAVLRSGTAYGAMWGNSVTSGMTFNGKSIADNKDLFREIVYPYPNDGTSAALHGTIASLLSFLPDIVVYQTCRSGVCSRVMPDVEQSWPATAPRPLYLTSGSQLLGDDFLSFLADDDRRRRFFSVDTVASNAANLKLTARYNAEYNTSLTPAAVPQGAYDAFYLLAYAAYAAEDGALRGSKLAAGIERLLPPGIPIDVGPAQMYEAFATLDEGKRIDLNGTGTALDFDPNTGETPADWAVYCVNENSDTKVSSVESGVIVSRKGAIEGSIVNCK